MNARRRYRIALCRSEQCRALFSRSRHWHLDAHDPQAFNPWHRVGTYPTGAHAIADIDRAARVADRQVWR